MKNSTRPTSKQIQDAQRELSRCLRLLVELFPDSDFRKYPPELQIDKNHAPLPEQLFFAQKSHRITLYTRRDLNRPVEEVLTILLHHAVHAANAFRWRRDCNSVSYHDAQFRSLARKVGFRVKRVNTRYGWADTVPTPKLCGVFRELALSEELFEAFRDPFASCRRRMIWHCGCAKLPDCEELDEMEAAISDATVEKYRGREIRSTKVYKIWKDEQYVPMLRLTGKWLRSYGFRENCRMKIEARAGQLTIQVRDP